MYGQRRKRQREEDRYLSLLRTDIPAAYFENDWTRFVSRHVPSISPFFPISVHWNHASFAGSRLAQYFRPARSGPPTTRILLNPFSLPILLPFPLSLARSLRAATFSFDTRARATIPPSRRCMSYLVPTLFHSSQDCSSFLPPLRAVFFLPTSRFVARVCGQRGTQRE